MGELLEKHQAYRVISEKARKLAALPRWPRKAPMHHPARRHPLQGPASENRLVLGRLSFLASQKDFAKSQLLKKCSLT